MKKIYLGLIIPILFISGVVATEFNFSISYDIRTGNMLDRPKAYYSLANETWFVIYNDPVSEDIKVDITDDDFTLMRSDTFSCGTNYCGRGDYNIIFGQEGVYFSGLAVESGSSPNAHIFEYTLANESFSTIDSESRANVVNSVKVPACVNRYEDTTTGNPLKVWDNLFNGNRKADLRYTIDDDFHGTYPSTFPGDGELNLPTTYEYPDDVQLVYCNNAYHLVIKNGTSIYDLIYDTSEDFGGGFTYKNIYSFTVTDWVVNDGDYGVTTIDNTLYLVMVNDTGGVNESGLINFQSWECGDDYTLTNVFVETYNQTEIDSTANFTDNKYMSKPFLTKDTYGIFNLFYLWRDDPTTYYLRASPNQEECKCSAWINTSMCIDQKIKQTRNCYPSECEIETRFVDSIYCEKEFNRTQGIFDQEFIVVSETSVCDTGLLTTLENPIIRCDTHLDIPMDCENVNVTSTMKVTSEYIDIILQGNQLNFTTKVCSPLTDCDVDTAKYCEDCKDQNVTETKEVTTYVAGDSVDNAFILDGTNCAVHKAWYISVGATEGWYKHRVVGTTTYECLKSCGGDVCITEGLIEYSAQQFIDCTINSTSKIECDYGCDQETGLCKTRLDIDEDVDKVDSATNIFLDFILKPTKTQKFLTGMVVSAFVGFLGFSYASGGKAHKHAGLIFMILFMGGFSFFAFIGYIPSIMIILILFGVGAFVLMKNIGG